MLSRTAIESATSFSVRGRRRRLGAWLLVGWFAYWFTTVAQACCVSFAADPGSVGRTPAFHVGELSSDASGFPTFPPLPDIDCGALSAIGPAATTEATAAFGNLDLPTVNPPASGRFVTDDHYRSIPASVHLHPPAPGVPLYLRNQRLLI